jgi:ribosomal protein L19
MRARLLLASLVVVLVVAAASAQAPPALSGTWRYNADASDIGGTAGDDGSAPAGPIGGFGMRGRQPLGGYGSPGGMASPGGADMDPQARKQRMELVRELLEPVRRLTIAQDATSVSFTYDDGRTVRYRTNGKAEKHQAMNGVVETETRWKKGKLVRETNLDDGMSVEETFELVSPRGLVIEIEVSGGVGRRKPVRRVYDPVD